MRSLRLCLSSLCSYSALGTSLQLSLQAPYLVLLEVGLQGDRGQKWGSDRTDEGVLGRSLQGPQQDEAQTQDTSGHDFRA